MSQKASFSRPQPVAHPADPVDVVGRTELVELASWAIPAGSGQRPQMRGSTRRTTCSQEGGRIRLRVAPARFRGQIAPRQFSGDSEMFVVTMDRALRRMQCSRAVSIGLPSIRARHHSKEPPGGVRRIEQPMMGSYRKVTESRNRWANEASSTSCHPIRVRCCTVDCRAAV